MITKKLLKLKKPKSWLKSVSAFANTAGGTLFFGVDNAHNVVGLSDPQKDAEDISRLIKERISPTPRFILTAEQEYGKAVLVLSIPKGTHTPYYYKADEIREAYIRLGDESIAAPDYILHELVLDGMNESFDALVSKYDVKDFAFSKLRERYRRWTGKSFNDKFLVSFGLVDEDTNKLTNAGVLIADDCPSPTVKTFLRTVEWLMAASYKTRNLVRYHQRDAIQYLLMYLPVSAIWNVREVDLRRLSNGIKYVQIIQKKKCLHSHLLLHNSL